jgi:hypothetical protein
MSLNVKMTADKAGGTAPDGSTVAGQKQEAELWVQRDSVDHVMRDGLETVIDFSRRRIIEIDRGAGTYVDSSLHADIALRHLESPNRQHVWSVIQAGGGDASGFSPIMTEHQLSVLGTKRATTIADLPDARVKGTGGWLRSMLARTPRSDISVELRDSDVVFTSESGRVLVSYAREGFDAGPDLMHRFALFLRLTYGG